MSRRRVLVAGVSGVVGLGAARAFSSTVDGPDGWDVVGLSRRRPARLPAGVAHVAVDLADEASCRTGLAAVGDVTHVVYAALYEKPGLVGGWFERDQMERNRLMLRHLLDHLPSVAGGLEHLTLLQGTKAYGVHHGTMRIPGREREPRHRHENFYWQQEDLLRQRGQDAPWSWTVLRPQIVLGDALASNMNPVTALGAWAAALKLHGRPLDYPGGPDLVAEAVDADIVGRAARWAATEPSARDEVFNVTNGDVFRMRGLWPALADAFGMEPGPDRPERLADAEPWLTEAWRTLVSRFDLDAPAELREVVGQSLVYVDTLLCAGMDHAPPPALVSTVKIRQAGFHDCADTEDVLVGWIRRLQDQRVLPPRDW